MILSDLEEYLSFINLYNAKPKAPIYLYITFVDINGIADLPL